MIVEGLPEERRGRPPIYPWDEWADGQVRTLVQGEHFHSSLSSFRSLVHRTKEARGMKAETRIRGNTISVRFYE